MSFDFVLCQNKHFRKKNIRWKVPHVCCAKNYLNRQKTVYEHRSRVKFSDVCREEVCVNKRFNLETTRGKWTPFCLNSGHGAHMALMICGCITYEGMGTIIILNVKTNAANYIDIIENNILPFPKLINR